MMPQYEMLLYLTDPAGIKNVKPGCYGDFIRWIYSNYPKMIVDETNKKLHFLLVFCLYCRCFLPLSSGGQNKPLIHS